MELTATGAVTASQQIAKMFQDNHNRLEKTKRRAGSAVRVHEALKARPVLPLSEVCKRTTLSFPTATKAMELLVEHGIAREITTKRRNRLFVYDEYLAILNEGTEPP